jgi:PAS domain S-box-containing protein
MESKCLVNMHPFSVAFPRRYFNAMEFSIFNQANDAIIIHDAETGAIMSANRKACELYEFHPEELSETSQLPIYTRDYPYASDEAMRFIRKAATGEPQLFEWKTQSKSGREFWVEVSLKSVNVLGRKLVLAIVREITNRKLTEQRLKLQHSYLALLQETTMAVMNRLDSTDLLNTLVTRVGNLLGTSYGFIYLVNQREHLLELKASIFPEDALHHKIMLGEGLVGEVWLTGTPAVSPLSEGHLIAAAPLKSGSQVIGIIGVHYPEGNSEFREDEMTLLSRFAELASIALDNAQLYTASQIELLERQRAEEAYIASEERYRLLFNSVHDAIYVSVIDDNGLPGKIVEANETGCRRLGYSREELLDMTLFDIIPLECHNELQKNVINLHTYKHVLTESIHFSKDHRTIPVEVNSHLLYFDNRPCILSIARDLSERKRVEKDMARLDRLNLIGAMAAGIGHEIRNPLTTVRGFLQMLTGKEECVPYKDYFQLMVQELDRANSIITEFLTLAKNKAVDLKLGNINAILKILLPVLEAGAILYDKTIKTELGNIPDMPIDEKEIRQLILNLVRNGLDAMPPGGTLRITTTCNDAETILSVHDQGKGIPPDLADKIGTPFFTTKEYGVGLGLAVCYSIAARHNATIAFDSSPTGTTFFVNFKHK